MLFSRCCGFCHDLQQSFFLYFFLSLSIPLTLLLSLLLFLSLSISLFPSFPPSSLPLPYSLFLSYPLFLFYLSFNPSRSLTLSFICRGLYHYSPLSPFPTSSLSRSLFCLNFSPSIYLTKSLLGLSCSRK